MLGEKPLLLLIHDALNETNGTFSGITSPADCKKEKTKNEFVFLRKLFSRLIVVSLESVDKPEVPELPVRVNPHHHHLSGRRPSFL
jgi:hypothetical protein